MTRFLVLGLVFCSLSWQAQSACVPNSGYPWPTNGCLTATDLNNAINNRAPVASPGLTGSPTAPTPPVTSNSTSIATTAFVTQAVPSRSIDFFGADSSASASTNQTAINSGLVWAMTVGGILTVPSKSSCYITGPLTIPEQTRGTTVPKPNLSLVGTGTSSCLQLAGGANGDLLSSANFYRYVHRHLTANASGGASSITVDDSTNVNNGDYLTIVYNDASLGFFTVQSVSGSVVSLSGTLAGAAAAGNPWWDASTIGPQNITISNLYLDGNVANQPYPSNVAASQSLSGSGNLTLRSSSVIGTPWENQFLYVYSSGNDSARTISVTGTRRNKDGSSSSLAASIAGGNGSFVIPHGLFETVTQIAVDGATAGTIQAGFIENVGNGLSIFGPFPKVSNVLFQNTMGLCYRRAWLPGGAFQSGYGSADAREDNLNCEYSYGGGARLDGPPDSPIYRWVSNYTQGVGVYLGRWAIGAKMFGAHVAGGLGAPSQVSHGPGGTLIEPLYGFVIEGVGVECYGCTAEEGVLANVLVRGNSLEWMGGEVFDIDNSANSRVGFRIGDTSNGWANAASYVVDTQCYNLTGGCVVFNSDSGGILRLSGGIGSGYAAGPVCSGTIASSTQIQGSLSSVTAQCLSQGVIAPPTSCTGLPTGTLWNNSGTAGFCP